MFKVSVVIPVYNTAPYLRRCLDSVTKQTLCDIEIICVNDASTDSSLAILSEYAKRDERIKIITLEKNKGAGAARNIGLAASHGNFIGFVDSDDYVDLNFYERLYCTAVNEQSDIVKGNIRLVNYDGTTKINNNIAEVSVNKAYFIYSPTAIYKRNFLSEHHIKYPIGLDLGEDSVFEVQAVLYCNKISLVPDVYYHYLRREFSADTRFLDENKILSALKASDIIVDLINNACQDKISYDIIFKKIFTFRINALFNSNNDDAIRKNIIHKAICLFKKYKYDKSTLLIVNADYTKLLINEDADALSSYLANQKQSTEKKAVSLCDAKSKELGTHQTPMKILFVISALEKNPRGGLEKVGILLASELVKRGHQVTILTHRHNPPVMNLAPQVDVVLTERPKNLIDIKKIRKRLIALSPDICVPMFSWRDLMFWPLIVQGTGIRLCISEHNDPWKIEEERWNREERIACMELADSIHLLQEGFIQSLPDELHEKVHIISNPVDVMGYAQHAEMKKDAFSRRDATLNEPRSKSVIIASRLADPAKQISLAIEAFSLLPLDCADWILEIYGQGPDRELFEQRIDRFHLRHRVFLRGYNDDMPTAYAASQICAIPSKFEGFCLSMVEAMATGLPVVAFADCIGIRHSAIHNETALLAPEMTAQSFADALTCLMQDEHLRLKLGQQAQKHVQAFSPHEVVNKWENMLRTCASIEEPFSICHEHNAVQLLKKSLIKGTTFRPQRIAARLRERIQ